MIIIIIILITIIHIILINIFARQAKYGRETINTQYLIRQLMKHRDLLSGSSSSSSLWNRRGIVPISTLGLAPPFFNRGHSAPGAVGASRPRFRTAIICMITNYIINDSTTTTTTANNDTSTYAIDSYDNIITSIRTKVQNGVSPCALFNIDKPPLVRDVYIYIYIYICMCMYMYMHLSLSLSLCVYMYMHLSLSMFCSMVFSSVLFHYGFIWIGNPLIGISIRKHHKHSVLFVWSSVLAGAVCPSLCGIQPDQPRVCTHIS